MKEDKLISRGMILCTTYRATQLLEMNPTQLSFLFSELSCSWKQAAPFGFSLFFRYFKCLCVFLLFCLGNGAEWLTFTQHVSVTHEANSLMCPWGRRSLKIKPLWIPGFLSVFFSFQLRNNFLLFSRNFPQSHISLKSPLRSIHGKCWLPKMGTIKSQHHPVENSLFILHYWPKSGRAVLCKYPSCPTVMHTAFWDEFKPLLQLKNTNNQEQESAVGFVLNTGLRKIQFPRTREELDKGRFPQRAHVVLTGYCFLLEAEVWIQACVNATFILAWGQGRKKSEKKNVQVVRAESGA